MTEERQYEGGGESFEHLATPENLTPPRTVYVMWFKERDAEPLNQGLLETRQGPESKPFGASRL